MFLIRFYILSIIFASIQFYEGEIYDRTEQIKIYDRTDRRPGDCTDGVAPPLQPTDEGGGVNGKLTRTHPAISTHSTGPYTRPLRFPELCPYRDRIIYYLQNIF